MASTSRTLEAESETRKLHALRLALLTAALDTLPTLREMPGVRAIPFVQVSLAMNSFLTRVAQHFHNMFDFEPKRAA